MTRLVVRLLAFSAVMAVACTGPTDVCGCSPAIGMVVVTGRVTDAADAAVADARVAIDGVPATMSSDPRIAFIEAATTADDGSFVARAYSSFGAGAGELALRAAVVRAATTDTVRLRFPTTARFRTNGVPDTVTLAVKLP